MWHPKSYLKFKSYLEYFSPQQPVFAHLSQMPPIVTGRKCQMLRALIAECEDKKQILFHSGDCAEPFEDTDEKIINKKIRYYKSCETTISRIHKKPAVIIGRIAGQYAKPRSQQFQLVNGVKTHNYKGDNVNTKEQREPCPQRQKEGYINSVITHNHIAGAYSKLFTSHEGLVLPFECSMTRPLGDAYYCLSAHLLWIGERTRQLDGAHIEFFRGVRNPIGVKISSKITKEDFTKLVETLNPKNEKGKLLVIVRMGDMNVSEKLKELIEVKVERDFNFLFVTDPMHGNTFTLPNGLKTRPYSSIVSQVNKFSEQMRKHSLGYGLSIEATYLDVKECYDGDSVLMKDVTEQNYKSKCDPRLNQNQAIQLLKDIKFA